MKTSKRLVGFGVQMLLMLSLMSTIVLAQTPPPPPPAAETQFYQAERPSQAGPYAQGSKRVNVVGGMGRTYGQNYLLLGAGFSYYVADGLALGLAGEGWVLQDPTIWKVSPEIRYTIWQMKSFKPYLGAFYRRSFISAPYEDYSSWGGRAGISYQKGGSHISVGVVHEEYLDCDSSLSDCNSTYPEISFWFSI